MATLLKHEAEAQDQVSGDGGQTGTAGSVSAPQTPGGGERGGVLGWLDRHVGNFLRGLVRTGEHAGDFVAKLDDVLTGEKDWSVSALAASALGTVGSGVGAVYDGITGENHHWFEEGRGVAGTPVAAPTDPTAASQYSPVVARPHDLPSLMQGVTDSYQVGSAPGSNGDVRITRVDNGTGTPAYVVCIPGTESWNPSAGATGRDLTANLALVAGNPSAAAESVRAAMDQAHIPPGSPVMLVGHSQGGIIAGTLAADHSFVEKYGVTNVLTYGAPIDHLRIDPSVQVLQVQHATDIVPRLDLGGLQTGSTPFPSTQAGVVLDNPGHFWDAATNHSYVEYANSVRDELGANTPEGEILRQYQSSLGRFFVAPGGTVTAVDVPVSRAPQP
ncbi:hypothetical protein G5V58_20935 [Nocardioides anomalus]|uniref:GPI inositol-deacylase PGAP1-like alpha/beta domain-containing protein n=1 Tax=Nocardioides anomalus TaxID=2712223 RepID=A0A6G6WIL8_9ACTN|nr:hypothetical protein [Nocardioides anomalus]QIG44910.1 hypothetical protein G5V58_20935 [Nocardioides anomalus]